MGEYKSRRFSVPQRSLLILGPRGTGKSTFIRRELKPQLEIDLLSSKDFRVLSKDPSELESMVAHLSKNETVFIDEIQKLPILLDEVHRLIEKYKIKFYLTGSSARKIKREGVNLLAGRASVRKFFPLSMVELGEKVKIQDLIFRGTLPGSLFSVDDEEANDFLWSYVNTYLKEEIFQESLTRNIQEFTHFIEVAGQYHGQIINFENISREIGKSGDTVRSWFQILSDTLVGDLLLPCPLKIYPRETQHPKFYYFDPGVARAAEGHKTVQGIPEKQGYYFETIILNELRSYISYANLDMKIFYYNVPSVGDIDFVVEVRKKTLNASAKYIAIEVKNATTWDAKFEKVLRVFADKKPEKLLKSVGVYRGSRRLTRDGVHVFPVESFVQQLWSGKLLSDGDI